MTLFSIFRAQKPGNDYIIGPWFEGLRSPSSKTSQSTNPSTKSHLTWISFRIRVPKIPVDSSPSHKSLPLDINSIFLNPQQENIIKNRCLSTQSIGCCRVKPRSTRILTMPATPMSLLATSPYVDVRRHQGPNLTKMTHRSCLRLPLFGASQEKGLESMFHSFRKDGWVNDVDIC